jgi:hypothetical protein
MRDFDSIFILRLSKSELPKDWLDPHPELVEGPLALVVI